MPLQHPPTARPAGICGQPIGLGKTPSGRLGVVRVPARLPGVDSHFGLIVLVVVAALMVVVGLVYVGGGLAEARRYAILRRQGQATKATLVSLRRSGGYRMRAIVRFRAGGDRMITVSSTASKSARRVASSKTIAPGRQLVVRYLPDDPANVLVDGFDTRTQPWIYLICGVAAIIAGLLLAAITLPSLGWDIFRLG
jgi:hypothetical protein